MKRSEMIIYLHKLLLTFEDCQLDITAANEILEGLEHMGMVPPVTTIESVLPGIPDFTVNKWDEE